MSTPEETTAELETIGRVLGRTPSGVFILTATDGEGHATGMLASWVQQASFNPPAVTMAVNKSRYLNDWLTKSPHVVLNLVGASQTSYLKHFGKGFEPDQPAFEGIDTADTAHNVPALAGALGYLVGKVSNKIESGDHVVYLVEIESAHAGEKIDEDKPMVHIRKNGFHY
ncbi:flavin reductase family protein [Thalassoroseus pseudoceratinae]|uniref:flavin reductase family protein n=1 Tax=Thalassoroseus pseudoceratinae TaxID=2713176 RepID=UPI0014208078|nr:flavin reductase family protein [Thalassoroseus pseudoceratinae]